MNEIVNKFLLAGHKFMPKIHLKEPRFTCSACGPFTKNKERIRKFKETGDKNYIYKNELYKTCYGIWRFVKHDMAYGDFKDLAKETASDKVLRDKAFNIAETPKYDKYQGGLTTMVYNFYDKKSAWGSGVTNNEIKQNLQLAKELHKPISWNFRKRTVYSEFKDNIWDTDLADMQLRSKVNKEFRFLLCVIDIFSKYAWVVPLKDKKGVSIVNDY